jgi:hypothetical protein
MAAFALEIAIVERGLRRLAKKPAMIAKAATIFVGFQRASRGCKS